MVDEETDLGEVPVCSRFRALFESVDCPVFVIERDGRIIDANTAGVELLGYSERDLRVVSFWDNLDDPSGTLKAKLLSVEAIGSVSLSARLKRADGLIAEVDLNGTLDEQGSLLLVARSNDRAELVDAFHTRLRQQELLAELGMFALREKSLDALFALAVKVVVDGLDVEFAKVLKLTPQRDAVRVVAGVGWLEALVGDGLVPIGEDSQAGYTLASAAPVIVDDLRTESRFSGPALLRNHGIVSGLSCVIGPFEDPWGVLGAHTQDRRGFSRHDANFLAGVANIIGQTVISRDANVRAGEQEMRLELALQAADLVIWHLEVDTGLFEIEGDWERALGLKTGDLGTTWTEFLSIVHPEDRAMVESSLEAHVRGDAPLFSALYRVQVQSEVLWFSSRGRGVSHDASGTPWRILGVHENVTERVKSEEEKRALETQLQHAQKMEAVGRIAGGVAHDFNNILTTITGYVDLVLSETDEDSQIAQDLKEVQGASTRARLLTRQLLALSRREIVQVQVCEVDQALHQLSRLLRKILGHSIRFSLDLDASDARVSMDPGQFEQMVLNLASNAKDAMTRGGVFSIRSEMVFDEALDEWFVVLVFEDTGNGIDPEIRSKIFEPFFTTKGVGDGTGLGLSLIYNFVQQCDGEIRLDSSNDDGTRFVVRLPTTEEALEESTAADDLETYTGKERILFVEDDDRLRNLGVRVLESAGYEVSVASNAAQAEAIFSSSLPFHLMLSDVVMPGDSGPDLAERLRESDPKLKVLFVSGYTEDPRIEEWLNDDVISFLPKPFSPRRLLKTVRHVLAGS